VQVISLLLLLAGFAWEYENENEKRQLINFACGIAPELDIETEVKRKINLFAAFFVLFFSPFLRNIK